MEKVLKNVEWADGLAAIYYIDRRPVAAIAVIGGKMTTVRLDSDGSPSAGGRFPDPDIYSMHEDFQYFVTETDSAKVRARILGGHGRTA